MVWLEKVSKVSLSFEEPTISSKPTVTMKHVIFCMLFSIFIFVRHNFMSKSIHLLYDHYFSKKDIDLNLMVCMYWDQKLNKTFTFAHFLKHLLNWHSWRKAMCNISFKPVLPKVNWFFAVFLWNANKKPLLLMFNYLNCT